MFKLKLPALSRAQLVLNGFLLLTIAALLFGFFRSCHPAPTLTRGTADSVLYWKNRAGQLVASQRATTGRFAVKNEQIQSLLDSIARLNAIRPKVIRELVVATIEGHSQLAPLPGTLVHDTIQVPGDPCPQTVSMGQIFQSRWYTADVRVGKDAYLNLSSRDTITAMWRIVKEGKLFHRTKYLQFDITLADTTRRVTGIRTYRFEDKPKEWAVNLDGTMLYVKQSFQPLVGLSLVRSTGRLQVGAFAGQNLNSFPLWKEPPAWYGGVRVSYSLLKF